MLHCISINIHASLFVQTFFGFPPKFRKRIKKLKRAFHLFVELIETNPLMYNIKDLGWKRSPAILLKIVVQTNGQTGGIDFGMYSQKPEAKLKNSWRRGKQYTSSVTLGGGEA